MVSSLSLITSFSRRNKSCKVEENQTRDNPPQRAHAQPLEPGSCLSVQPTAAQTQQSSPPSRLRASNSIRRSWLYHNPHFPLASCVSSLSVSPVGVSYQRETRNEGSTGLFASIHSHKTTSLPLGAFCATDLLPLNREDQGLFPFGYSWMSFSGIRSPEYGIHFLGLKGTGLIINHL